MSQTDTTPYVKMTVRLHKPLFKRLQDELKDLPLRQDAFLDHLISVETPVLAAELSGVRLSPEVRRFVSGQLKRLDPMPVSIKVRTETQVALNKVVADTNIVRDAFVNRLLIFCAATPQLRAWLGVPDWIEQLPEHPERINFRLQTAPLQALKTLMTDPFLFLREGALDRENGLYRFRFPGKWRAFNCYMDDHEVPNPVAEKALLKDWSTSLETLEREERGVFAMPDRENKT